MRNDMGHACTMPVHGLNPACHCATDGDGGRANGAPLLPALPVAVEEAGVDDEPAVGVDLPFFLFLLVVAPAGTLGAEGGTMVRPA